MSSENKVQYIIDSESSADLQLALKRISGCHRRLRIGRAHSSECLVVDKTCDPSRLFLFIDEAFNGYKELKDKIKDAEIDVRIDINANYILRAPDSLPISHIVNHYVDGKRDGVLNIVLSPKYRDKSFNTATEMSLSHFVPIARSRLEKAEEILSKNSLHPRILNNHLSVDPSGTCSSFIFNEKIRHDLSYVSTALCRAAEFKTKMESLLKECMMPSRNIHSLLDVEARDNEVIKIDLREDYLKFKNILDLNFI